MAGEIAVCIFYLFAVVKEPLILNVTKHLLRI